ncbi:MAG: YiiD C-terminal domain-containing protein [Candidatus Saccharibacteria bacterium]|nr:YiiD C-terminal domain-containing protein [Moraxellaceae bacterium]
MQRKPEDHARLMDIQYLEQYVHTSIPLTKAMGVEVREASSDKVIVFVPLAPNINHMNNIFGGSASTAAILAAWCLVFTKMKLQGLSGHIVIHKNTMTYEKPISAGFTATAQDIDEHAWSKLVSALERNRMARLSVHAVLECGGQQVGHLEGAFVVLPANG